MLVPCAKHSTSPSSAPVYHRRASGAEVAFNRDAIPHDGLLDIGQVFAHGKIGALKYLIHVGIPLLPDAFIMSIRNYKWNILECARC